MKPGPRHALPYRASAPAAAPPAHAPSSRNEAGDARIQDAQCQRGKFTAVRNIGGLSDDDDVARNDKPQAQYRANRSGPRLRPTSRPHDPSADTPTTAAAATVSAAADAADANAADAAAPAPAVARGRSRWASGEGGNFFI